MANIFMRFPGGRAKALTLSYDDGVEQDIRLIEIMQKNGLKGTFNLNSGLYAQEGTVYPEGTIHRRMSRKQCMELYKDSGMEVAVHGYTHPYLEQLPANICTMEVLRDRECLERDFDCMVRGLAYPFGTYSDDVVETLKRCGIVYARTVTSTHDFAMPEDWLRLPATCHHRDERLMELAKTFAESRFVRGPRLFYLWGHSYEFEADDNWHIMEEFAAYMGGREDIWYVTNIQLYDYVAAYEQLQFSVDGRKVYNPTAVTLYFEKGNENYCIRPGETLITGN